MSPPPKERLLSFEGATDDVVEDMAGQFLGRGEGPFEVRQFVDLIKGGQALTLHGPGRFRCFQASVVEGEGLA